MSRNPLARLVFALLFLVLTTAEWRVAAQQAIFRSGTERVTIAVVARDRNNRPLAGLSAADFEIVDEGEARAILDFRSDVSPISVALLLDSSGSMKNRLQASMESLRYILQSTMPGDEFFLVQFADNAKALGGFSDNPAEIQRRLGLVEAKGWTSLLDALALGTHQMRGAKNRRRVLLVLSDGNDNNSRYSESEIRNMVIEADVRVYAVALNYRPRVLRQLAEETGGKILVANHMGELSDVVQRLSTEIRSQYVLGYSSNNQHADGKYRRVKVDVVPPAGLTRINTSWRRGYYAPGE